MDDNFKYIHALYCPIKHGYIDIIMILLDNYNKNNINYDINTRIPKGYYYTTLLISAVQTNRLNIVKIILNQKGVDLNIISGLANKNALWYAINNNINGINNKIYNKININIIKELLKAGSLVQNNRIYSRKIYKMLRNVKYIVQILNDY